jgi:hypothetical protein
MVIASIQLRSKGNSASGLEFPAARERCASVYEVDGAELRDLVTRAPTDAPDITLGSDISSHRDEITTG